MARTITGVVTSAKSPKTIIVTTSSRKTHPLYRKQYSVNTKFMAHDEKSEAGLGDTVTITECRPLSARKRFKLTKIVQRPAISEESRAAISTDDTNRRASKAKVKEEEAEEKK